MFKQNVRCVFNNLVTFAIGELAYIFVLFSVLGDKPVDWIYWLLAGHFFVGLFVIAAQNRPLGFGLLNLACEVTLLVAIASISIIPVSFCIALGLIPRQWFGIPSTIGGDIGFVIMGGIHSFVVVTIPLILLYLLFRYGVWFCYPDEPEMK